MGRGRGEFLNNILYLGSTCAASSCCTPSLWSQLLPSYSGPRNWRYALHECSKFHMWAYVLQHEGKMYQVVLLNQLHLLEYLYDSKPKSWFWTKVCSFCTDYLIYNITFIAMSQMDAYKKREIIYPKLFEFTKRFGIALIIITHDLVFPSHLKPVFCSFSRCTGQHTRRRSCVCAGPRSSCASGRGGKMHVLLTKN